MIESCILVDYYLHRKSLDNNIPYDMSIYDWWFDLGTCTCEIPVFSGSDVDTAKHMRACVTGYHPPSTEVFQDKMIKKYMNLAMKEADKELFQYGAYAGRWSRFGGAGICNESGSNVQACTLTL